MTHSTKTKARNIAFVEEAIVEQTYSWNCVDDSKHIVELKWAFSRLVVGL